MFEFSSAIDRVDLRLIGRREVISDYEGEPVGTGQVAPGENFGDSYVEGCITNEDNWT